MSRCLSGQCKYCNTTVQNYYTNGDEIICDGCADAVPLVLEINKNGHLKWKMLTPFTRNDILDLD